MSDKKLGDAISRLAALYDNGELLASTFQVDFLDNVTEEISKLRSENIELLTVNLVKDQRIAELEGALSVAWDEGHRAGYGNCHDEHVDGFYDQGRENPYKVKVSDE